MSREEWKRKRYIDSCWLGEDFLNWDHHVIRFKYLYKLRVRLIWEFARYVEFVFSLDVFEVDAQWTRVISVELKTNW